jgi:predicted ATP-grasp superfamily ATP-dependent carboligase
MEFFPVDEGFAIEKLQGSVALVAVVSPGNVGQLAVDLIVHTTCAPLIGYLSHPALLPCVGAAPHPHCPGRLASTVEAYLLHASGTLLLQQRAPAAPGTQREFAEALAAWCSRARLSKVSSSEPALPSETYLRLPPFPSSPLTTLLLPPITITTIHSKAKIAGSALALPRPRL